MPPLAKPRDNMVVSQRSGHLYFQTTPTRSRLCVSEWRCRAPGSLLSPMPRWVPGEAVFFITALWSLSPPLPAAHMGAIGHASHGPAVLQALATPWLLSAFFLRSVCWWLHLALLPAFRAPGRPRCPLVLQGGGVHVPRVLPLPLPPLSGQGCHGCAGLRDTAPYFHTGLLPLFTKALEGLTGLWQLVWGGPEGPIDLRQGCRGGRAALWV